MPPEVVFPVQGRGTQVVRERSAKPLCVGSIPTRASNSLLYLAVAIEFVVAVSFCSLVPVLRKSFQICSDLATLGHKTQRSIETSRTSTFVVRRSPLRCTSNA